MILKSFRYVRARRCLGGSSKDALESKRVRAGCEGRIQGERCTYMLSNSPLTAPFHQGSVILEQLSEHGGLSGAMADLPTSHQQGGIRQIDNFS